MEFLGEKYLISNDAGVRIYNRIKRLPIVDPHNHANVKEIALNQNYANAWQLFAATDHYVWEVLRKCGVTEDYLTGSRNPEEKWLKMAEVFPAVAGNPVYEWIHLDLKRYLGIGDLLGPDTGEKIWNNVNKVLAQPDKRPLQLLEQIGVECMCSTDDPVDLLEEHEAVNQAAGRKLIRPTWRPDKAMKIFAPGWHEYIQKIEARFNLQCNSVNELMAALRESHDYFAARGCTASDHGIETALSAAAAYDDANTVYRKARNGEKISCQETEIFMSYFLGEAAELNVAKGWVCQLHLGAVRDVRDVLFKNIGADSGGDICNHFQNQMIPLNKFLNRFDGRLKTVLYCLDPAQQPLLATTARAFGEKVRLGSAWWLCDTPIGMRRQLEYIGSVDLLSNFAGMVSDSRKLLSYGSRFEMFRRVLADVIGKMVEYGQMPQEIGEQLAVNIAYEQPKKFFSL
jgi:glucuronate isomerase